MRPTLGSVGVSAALPLLGRNVAAGRRWIKKADGRSRFLGDLWRRGPFARRGGAFAAADGWAATAAGFGWAGASVVATELAVGSPGQNDGRGGGGDELGIQARKCARVAGTRRFGLGPADYPGDAQTKAPTGEPRAAAPRAGWRARAPSAWRPRHLPLGEEVYVKVRNGFTGVGAVVDHEAEAGGKVEFFCDDVRDRE